MADIEFEEGDKVRQQDGAATYRGTVQEVNQRTGCVYVRWHRGFACWVVASQLTKER
jgi:hypothetical protein